MSVFFAALLWGAAVLASFFGWGSLLHRLLLAEKGTSPRDISATLDAVTWGLAFSAFVAGILNLCGIASQNVLIAFVLIGVGVCLLQARSLFRKPKLPSAFIAVCVLVAALLLIRFAATVIIPGSGGAPGSTFNPHDDMHSYLVSIERLLQTGSLGLDPFNSRLMMSSVGAQHFLAALLLAVLPQDNIHLLDSGIGLIALVLSTGALALRMGLSRMAAVALMLVPLALPMENVNISSTFTSAAALLALVSCLVDTNASLHPKYSVIPALLLAAVCGFKSTMIPPAIIFVGIFCLLHMVINRSAKSLLNVLFIPLLAVLFLLPWMLWQYQNSGTLLYPILGLGNHIAHFFPAQFPSTPIPPALEATIFNNKLLPLILALLLLFLLPFKKLPRNISRQSYIAALAFFLAWSAAVPLIGYATEFPDLGRYLFPTYAAGIILATVFLCALLAPIFPRLTLIPLLAFLLATFPQWLPVWTIQIPRNIVAAANGSIRPLADDVARFHDLQQSVPTREPLLVYLTNPSVLDFTRNPLYVVDWPGESSPPPGMPVFSGTQSLTDYLLAHHIRYFAYSYAQQANFPRQVYGADLDPAAGRTIRRQAAESFAFQDDLRQMAKSHAVIFDNGLDEVIDLATPR